MAQILNAGLIRVVETISMYSLRDNRNIVAVLMIGFFASFSSGLLAPVLPIYFEALGIATSQMGILYSLSSISGAVSRTPLGFISDRIGRKKLINACLILNALSGSLYILTKKLHQLIVLQIFQGIVVAGFAPLMIAIASLYGAQRKGSTIMTYTTATTMGFTLGMPLGSRLSAGFGFESLFITYAFLLLPALAFSQVLLFLPEQRGKRSLQQLTGEKKHLQKRRSTVKLLFSLSLSFSTLLVFSFLYSFQYNVYSPYIPLIISNLGVDLANVGSIFLIGWVTYVIVQIPAGKLSDKIGRTKVIILGMVIGIISTLSMRLSRNIIQFSIFWGLSGVGTGMALVFYALAADLSLEQERSTVMGLIGTTYVAGASLGPLLGGWASQIYGVTNVFLLATIAQSLSILPILLLHFFQRKDYEVEDQEL